MGTSPTFSPGLPGIPCRPGFPSSPGSPFTRTQGTVKITSSTQRWISASTVQRLSGALVHLESLSGLWSLPLELPIPRRSSPTPPAQCEPLFHSRPPISQGCSCQACGHLLTLGTLGVISARSYCGWQTASSTIGLPPSGARRPVMGQSPLLPLAGVGSQHPSFHMRLGRVIYLSSLGPVSTGISLRSRWALSSLLKIKAASLKTKAASLSVGNWAWTEHRSSLARSSPARWTGGTQGWHGTLAPWSHASSSVATLLKHCKTERASATQRKMAEKVVVGLLWLDHSDTGAAMDVSSWEQGKKHGNLRNAMLE